MYAILEQAKYTNEMHKTPKPSAHHDSFTHAGMQLRSSSSHKNDSGASTSHHYAHSEGTGREALKKLHDHLSGKGFTYSRFQNGRAGSVHQWRKNSPDHKHHEEVKLHTSGKMSGSGDLSVYHIQHHDTHYKPSFAKKIRTGKV